MQYQSQKIKILHGKKNTKKHRTNVFLTTKRDNILTAESSCYYFIGLLTMLFNHFNYHRKENRTATNNKLVKIYRRYNI